MGNIIWHDLGFYVSLVKEVIMEGTDAISNALLDGQYEFSEGVYYGGNGDEASTTYLKEVFKQTLEGEYKNVVHIDVHSGYGPRYNMVIFNSVFEIINEKDSQEMFGYDNIIAYDFEAFYPTTGDTTDFYYRLNEQLGNISALRYDANEIGDGLNNLSKANTEIVNDITTLSAATEQVTASAQQSTELSEENYQRAFVAKGVLDNILEVSHEMDVYISE